jgi:hypothetical protein
MEVRKALNLPVSHDSAAPTESAAVAKSKK